MFYFRGCWNRVDVYAAPYMWYICQNSLLSASNFINFVCKRDVVYFDQHLGAVHSKCLSKYAFSCFSHNKTFFSDFTPEINKKTSGKLKTLKTAEKMKFDQLSGARSTRKLAEIHNIHTIIFLSKFWKLIPIYQRGQGPFHFEGNFQSRYLKADNVDFQFCNCLI